MAFTRTATGQALLWLLWLASPGRATADAAPDRRPHYEIVATLDADSHKLEGSVRVHFQSGDTPLSAVWLQLYGNGLKSRHSVHRAGRTLSTSGYGSTELRALRVDGVARLADAEGELLPGDLTRMRVPLPAPIAPHTGVVVELEFETALPALSSRTGHADDFHLVAQWYPKLAYMTAEGHFEAHPFERLGEFRANHASYDLSIHAPARFTVEAPGTRIEAGAAGVWRFQSGPATDVAFAACTRCRHTQVQYGDIEVRALFAAGTDEAAKRQRRVVQAGLAHFGRTLTPYPYAQLSLVTPPRGTRVDGMEYPGFIVLPPGPSPLESSPFVDGRHVAAHELAHQWFYALVSSDELRHPVLDEGLTEWAACDLLQALRATTPGLGLGAFDAMRAMALAGRTPPAPGDLPAYSYSDMEYGRAVYVRAALALESVRRTHGDARFRRALRRYVDGQRFAFSTPEALAAAFDAVYGDGFFAQTLGALMLRGEDATLQLSLVETRSEDDADHLTHVLARRRGVQLPTWVQLSGSDGRTLARLPWPMGSALLDIVAHTRERVFAVELDPDRGLLVDPDRSDQRWQRERPERDGHWTSLLFALGQALLGVCGP